MKWTSICFWRARGTLTATETAITPTGGGDAANASNDNDALFSDDDLGGESRHPEDKESDAGEAGNL
jgi:hypothetical protein